MTLEYQPPSGEARAIGGPSALDLVVGCKITGWARSKSGRPGIVCGDERHEFVVWMGTDWVNVVEMEVE